MVLRMEWAARLEARSRKSFTRCHCGEDHRLFPTSIIMSLSPPNHLTNPHLLPHPSRFPHPQPRRLYPPNHRRIHRSYRWDGHQCSPSPFESWASKLILEEAVRQKVLEGSGPLLTLQENPGERTVMTSSNRSSAYLPSPMPWSTTIYPPVVGSSG